MLYSSRWQKNDPLDSDHLVRKVTFRTDNARVDEAVNKEAFGYGDIDWENEPKRLLDYYHANRTEFKQEAEQDAASNGG